MTSETFVDNFLEQGGFVITGLTDRQRQWIAVSLRGLATNIHLGNYPHTFDGQMNIAGDILSTIFGADVFLSIAQGELSSLIEVEKANL